MKRSEDAGSDGVLRSAGAGGCFSCKAYKVARLLVAMTSSEQISLTAALKLPSSSLLVTAWALFQSSFICLLARLRVAPLSSCSFPSRHRSIRRRMMFVRFLFAPPLAGLTKMLLPKSKSCVHPLLSFGFFTMSAKISCRSFAHIGLALLGILLTSRP